jgi:hypothetical protein
MGAGVATIKEFVEFWLNNSVHADEQFSARRGHLEVEKLASNLVTAAEAQGFSRDQVEAELGGDIHGFIRNSIDSQNADETTRLKKDGH